MKIKKYLFTVIALAFGAFALVSCEKGDDDPKKEKEREKEQEEEVDEFLPIKDQQALLSASAVKTAQQIDFAKFAPLATVVDSIVVKGIAPLTGILSEILENEVFQEKYEIVQRMLKAEVLSLDLTEPSVKIEVDIVDSVYEGTPKLAMTNARVTDSDSGIELVMNYEGHQLYVKFAILDVDNTNVITVKFEEEQDLNGDFANSVNIPEALSLDITFDREKLLSFTSLLTTDLTAELICKDESIDLSASTFSCKKFSWGANFTFGDFYATATAEYKENVGVEVKFLSQIGEEKLVDGDVVLDAALESILAFDLTSLMNWAISPQNLRSVSGSLGLGKDVTINASLKHPMNCPFVIEKISGLVFNEQAVLTEEENKALIDSLNTLFNLEVSFTGYDEPQAKMQFMYYDVNFDKNAFVEANPIITNNKLAEFLKGKVDQAIIDKIISALNRTNVVPAIVAKDEDGNEVYMRLDQYLNEIDLKTPFNTVVNKFKEMLATYATDIADTMPKG